MQHQLESTPGREWLGRLARIRPAILAAREPADTSDRQHIRMFVLSHKFGPFIGLALPAFLLLLGFPADVRLVGFALLVGLFWTYPAALALGANYHWLSLASLQQLVFLIFWASHGYGGLTSPFLLWLAVVPLLGFLYSAPRIRLWLTLLAMMGIGTILFAILTLYYLPPPPADAAALHWLSLVSLLAASAYVAMMAVYFGRLLSSRNELALEVARRRANLTALDREATDLRHRRAARIASLSRLARQCRAPLADIVASCTGELSGSAGERTALTASDFESIRAAATRLGGLIDQAEAFEIVPLGGAPQAGHAA